MRRLSKQNSPFASTRDAHNRKLAKGERSRTSASSPEAASGLISGIPRWPNDQVIGYGDLNSHEAGMAQ